MIDIHTHILQGMDDGAASLREAQALLEKEWDTGVDRLFLTPHYNPETTAPDTFLTARETAWAALKAELRPEEADRIRLGAEVRFCPQLLSTDLKHLTLGGSDYLLLELAGQSFPPYLLQTAEKLLRKGIVPVLAHVERYAFFRHDPALLKQLTDLGVLAQVSAHTLFSREDHRFSQACLQHRLVQLVASDAHRMTGRKPCMDQVKKLPESILRMHHAFTEAIWENEVSPYIHTTIVKKTFFGYR